MSEATETAEEPGGDVVLDPDLDLDLDAAVPVQAEATRETTKVKIDGRVLEIPLLSQWPMKALYLIDKEEDPYSAFRLVLDEDDAEFLGMLAGPKVAKVMEHVLKVSGTSPGESSGSAASSPKKRSK
jgi:hypothetical protein